MDFFKKNLKIKVLCLLGSFVLWVYVMYSNPEITRSKIEGAVTQITNQEELKQRNLTPSVDFNPRVWCSIRGKRSFVTELMDRGIYAKGTIVDPREGLNSMLVSADSPGVVITMESPEMQIQLEKEVQKPVAIVPLAVGEFPSGYFPKEMTPSSSAVDVQGPSSQVAKVTQVLAPVEVKSMTQDFIQDVAFVPADEKGEEVEGVIPAVRKGKVRVSVYKQKEVPVRVALVNSWQIHLALSAYGADPSKITIEGPPEMIDQIQSISTVKVSAAQYMANPLLRVGLSWPKDVSGNVDSIRITVNDFNLATRHVTYPKDRILFTGGFSNAELEALRSSLPESVSFSVRVSKELSEQLNADQFTLSINKTSYDATTQSYPWVLKADYPFELINASPASLEQK